MIKKGSSMVILILDTITQYGTICVLEISHQIEFWVFPYKNIILKQDTYKYR